MIRPMLEFVVDQDLCKGLENIPVTIEGCATKEYPCFQYSPENVQGPASDVDPSECTLPGCSCHSHSCSPETCSCLQTYGQMYDSHGRLHDKGSPYQHGYCQPVFECNALCGCSEACGNRVVQRGLGVRLAVYLTDCRGWGVKALEPISRGTFVCEYAGEVLGCEEARRRQLSQGPQDNNYIIAVREHAAGHGLVSETFVDPARVGNVGRFLNHSCQPNLFMVPVRVHSLVPRLALFAGRDITAHEELTFDYAGCCDYQTDRQILGQDNDLESEARQILGQDNDLGSEASHIVTPRRKRCHCGAHNCAGFLPLDTSVLGS